MSGRKTRRQRREGRKKFDEVGKKPPLPIELTVFIRSPYSISDLLMA